MNYNNYLDPKNTPMSRKIPGRSGEMKETLAGSYAFKANDWAVLKRWLLTGSLHNAFYQNSDDMTEKNVEVLTSCIKQDAERVARETIYARTKGINFHTPILALVHLSMGSFNAKKKFREIFNDIIKTASNLYEFMSYTKALRGMGKTIHKAVLNWLKTKDAKELEYQFLKYQNRYGWTGRDVLRIMKPKTENRLKNSVYKWMVGRGFEKHVIVSQDFTEKYSLDRISAYEEMKKNNLTENQIIQTIYGLNLTHEMIPGNVKRTKEIWNALFQKMPLTATIRNLGNLTSKDIFYDRNNVKILEERLSKENLKKGMIHPLVLASAYSVYKGGHSIRGTLIWKPMPVVEDLIENAIESAFEILEPTGKIFFHALDVSGSMTSPTIGNLSLTPVQIESIIALATMRAEKDYFVGGFSNYFIELNNFRRTSSFRDVIDCKHLEGISFSGTNAAAAFEYATENKIYTDVFVCWTDNESWLGIHPALALKEYRNKINPEAKAIYITLQTYGDKITLVDPKDNNSYDIAGFSSDTIKLIQMITMGEI